jgi:hypothetical protein
MVAVLEAVRLIHQVVVKVAGSLPVLHVIYGLLHLL